MKPIAYQWLVIDGLDLAAQGFKTGPIQCRLQADWDRLVRTSGDMAASVIDLYFPNGQRVRCRGRAIKSSSDGVAA